MDMGHIVLQVSSKGLGEGSAHGKSKQLWGSAARAAILPSQGRRKASPSAGIQHFFQESPRPVAQQLLLVTESAHWPLRSEVD